MKLISIFDMFKICIGPSSSHTMGPWVAALDVIKQLKSEGKFDSVQQIKVFLCGSLAKTGAGHQTPMGVLMGLMGEDPATVGIDRVGEKMEKVKSDGTLMLGGQKSVVFPFRESIVFDLERPCPVHPNTLIFSIVLDDKTAFEYTYYSVGGGFIEKKDHVEEEGVQLKKFPYPMKKAKELVDYVEKEEKRMHEIIFENEIAVHSKEEVRAYALKIYEVMSTSIFRGCHSSGILPGGLSVRRRAAGIAKTLYKGGAYKDKDQWFANIRQTASNHFDEISRWVMCFALAVNEENAVSGRIVTAPTNGAAGVIPAVLMYYLTFDPSADIDREEKIIQFLLIASQIGFFFKKNASISAAAAGCQGEIGVSSSMAAGALSYVNGGDVKRVLMASEMAMEHHLGLTCDPIKGLVQVPCIERNTMGAIKALASSNLALSSDPEKAVVNLDDVISTMWSTAKDMSSKYKETSEGGLAVQVSSRYSEC